MINMRTALVILIYLLELSSEAVACGGYNIVTSYIRNCGGEDQIIRVSENSSTYVNKDCDVFSNVCTDVKPFTKAQGLLTVRKNSLMILNKTHGVCEPKKLNEIMLVTLAVFGIKGCSMKAGSSCDRNTKVMKFSNMVKTLRLLIGDRGSFQLHDEIKHDTGTSCLEAEIVFQA